MGNKGRLYLAEPPLFQNSPPDCFEIHPLSERLRLFRFSLKAVKSDQRRCLWTLPKALPLESGRERSPLHPEYCAVNYNVRQNYSRNRLCKVNAAVMLTDLIKVHLSPVFVNIYCNDHKLISVYSCI